MQVRDVRAMIGDEAPILDVWHTVQHGELDLSVRPPPSNREVPTDVHTNQHRPNGASSGSSRGKPEKQQNRGPPTEAYSLQPLPPDEAPSMLSRVRAYRNVFAEILVVGSILQKLEGEELRAFERFRLEEAQRDLRKEQRGSDREKGKLSLPSRRATSTEPLPNEPSSDEAGLPPEGVALEDIADARWDGITSRIVKKEGRRLKRLFIDNGGDSKAMRKAKTMA